CRPSSTTRSCGPARRPGSRPAPYTMMIVIVKDGRLTEDPVDSKRRMVESAAVLFREQGYSGTGFRDVIAHSGAPRGSIYHHFPGGKSQLAAETVRYAGDVVAARLERAKLKGDAVV